MYDETLYFNGINGATGTYGLRQMSSQELSNHILGIEEGPPDNLDGLQERVRQDALDRLRQERNELQSAIADLDPVADANTIAKLKTQIAALRREAEEKWGAELGTKEGVNTKNLAEAGWGLILPEENPLTPQIEEALSPLLAHRKSQAKQYCKIFKVRRDDSARRFLSFYNMELANPADPEKVPYYLLIVGCPEDISYRFQYQLDVQYAVGRIDFGADCGANIDAYANYARSVVEAETKVLLPARATFFGTANPDDRATALSAKHLVAPLATRLQGRYPGWQINSILKEAATKEHLRQHLGGDKTPAFLFAATHGMEFPINDSRQVPHQGALLCQDWPGPTAWRGKIPQDFYMAGDDFTGNTNLLGLIAFFFACYGAGTPLYDEFSKQAFKEQRETLAKTPFVAALPKAMLSLSKGGALAVVGHVERTWSNAFLGDGKSEQLTVFESAIERLLKGYPVGAAMEYFDQRYAALSTELTTEIERIQWSPIPRYDSYELARLWTSNNDARGYIIIGDPAVRLPVTQNQAIANERHDVGGRTVILETIVDPSAEKKLENPSPDIISDEEWQNTPLSVKYYIQRLQKRQS